MQIMRKSLNNGHVILLVLGMLLATGASHARGRLPSASGHGNLVMEGALRTFSFQAREFRDGHVHGNLVLKNRHLGVRARADIDCLYIDGDEAILSGILTQLEGIEDNLIGDEVLFRVRDNGEGRGDPSDQISLLIVETETPPLETFTCDDTLPVEINDVLGFQDIIGGNVQVRE